MTSTRRVSHLGSELFGCQCVGCMHTGCAAPGDAPRLACVAWYPRFVAVSDAVDCFVAVADANANAPSLPVEPDNDASPGATVISTSTPSIGAVVLQSTIFPRQVCAVAHDAVSSKNGSSMRVVIRR